MSLTVEFYRIDTHNCAKDDYGDPISLNPLSFPYGNASCGLACTVATGPHNAMRAGAGNDIYVTPAPDILTFATATTLAAACCIPGLLLLVMMWLQILELNWKARFGRREEDEGIGEKKKVNQYITLFRKSFELPLFGAAVLAILVIGERNFFSDQVRRHTEPVASVGKLSSVSDAHMH